MKILYCADCMKDVHHDLVKETDSSNYYECSICGYSNPIKKDVVKLSSRRIFTKPDLKKRQRR